MTSVNNEFLSICITQLWQVSLLIVLVLGLNKLLGRRRPHLAHLLWVVVLLKCLTPPIVAAPWSAFGLAEASLKTSAHDVDESATIVANVGRWPEQPWNMGATVVNESVIHFDSHVLGGGPPVSQSNPLSWRMTTATAMFVIWGLGAMGVFAVFAVRCQRQLRLIEACRADGYDEWSEVLNTLARRLGVRRHVSLVITTSGTGPAVVGLLHPRIVLPAALIAERCPRELEPILAHELIHVRRGDLWIGALQLIAQATWWFHPLIWAGNRWMNRDAERCCDESVIAELKYAPAKYARTLLDVLSCQQELTPMPLFPGVRPVDVTSQRLERIMRLGHGSLKRTPRHYWFLATLLALLTLPGAWMGLTAEEGPTDKFVHAGQAGDVGDFRTGLEAWSAEGENTVSGWWMKPAEPRPMVTVVYDVSEVLKKLTEIGVDDEHLEMHLIAHVRRFADSGRSDRVRHAAGVNSDAGVTGSIKIEGRPSAAYVLADSRLVVRQTQESHRRIKNALTSMRDFGFDQVTLAIRVISIPTKLVAQLNVDWSLFDSQHAEVEEREESDLQWKVNQQASSRAAVTVQKELPVLFASLDQKQVKRILQQVQGNAEANVLRTPKITLFNGQQVYLCDGVQRPFVVGGKKVGKDGFQPTIRVVNVGWRMDLRAIARDEATWIECRATFNEIRSVETRELPVTIKGQPIALQIPEVATSRIDVTINVPNSKTLLLNGITKTDKTGETTLLLMITPQRIPAVMETRDTATKADGPAAKASEHQPLITIAGPAVDQSAKQARVPSDADILRRFVEQQRGGGNDGGLPFLRETGFKDIRIVKELVSSYQDPARFVPLVGPAILHHAHYKCTVHFSRETTGEWPISFTRNTASGKSVIYVDYTYYRLVDDTKSKEEDKGSEKRVAS